MRPLAPLYDTFLHSFPNLFGYPTKMITRIIVGIWEGPLPCTFTTNFGFHSKFLFLTTQFQKMSFTCEATFLKKMPFTWKLYK